MPTSFQAVAVLVIGLVPGASYIWAFERQVGRWGVALSDRLVRFAGVSVIFHAGCAPATYALWRTVGPAVERRDALPWWLWAVAVAYAGVPLTAGSVIGRASRSGRRWASWFTGLNPAPRAWDYLFQGTRDGWVRLRLKSGVWLGGGFVTAPNGLRSYSAGYPEPQDLYLSITVNLDPDTGDFLFDDEGRPELVNGGILVRWEEVEYLEFIDA